MLRLPSKLFRFAVLSLVLAALGSPALANNNNNNGGGNNNNNNGGANNNNNNNNNNGAVAAGVRIDAQGVLRVMQLSEDPRFNAARAQAARAQLPQSLARPSKLRKISLNRLEAAVGESLKAGNSLPMEMIALAGLTRLEYVFFYPDSGDIVIAGPAEGFRQDSVGRMVGIETGQPCMLLDDLAVALRAYAPDGEQTNSISVSIDPTQEGLARMQATLRQLGSSFSPAKIQFIVNSLQQSLGLNEVTIKGIPAGTHFAHVLTEADYRMKLIGIGREAVPVRMRTYVSALGRSAVSSNALLRWYFVPDYQAVAVSKDGNAFKMVGQGVKLVGEDELVKSDGSRQRTRRQANLASKTFTEEFTSKFGLIAKAKPVYGQLRNLVDLTIAAAFIQHQGFYEKSGWDLGVLGREEELSVETLPAPRQVETAINAVIRGNRLITPIGGGVAIQARKALTTDNLQEDKGGMIAQQHDAVSLQNLAEGQWWWD